MPPDQHIEAALQAAVRAVLPDADAGAVLVRPCPDPKFGDYQSNALMALARARGMNPRRLAEQVKARLDVAAWCEPVEIAGAGFLNFRLKTAAIAACLGEALAGRHLFFAPAASPLTVVVDFSSPNVAKPMHVGHIRSTAIGDALQRVLRLLGHRVITDNHIGDWGTQFGKLLLGWKQIPDRAALERDAAAQLERLYKVINAECDARPERLEEAKRELVKLQSGDAGNTAIWKEMSRLSQAQFDAIYGRLGVKFDVTLGESFYNPRLGGVVADLLRLGVARESEGAAGVFSDGTLPPKEDPFLVNRDGEWAADPALVRKSDGGFNYMTTDLAALDYRMKTWSPHQIVYVVDDRQAPHFKKLFLAFARWKRASGAAPEDSSNAPLKVVDGTMVLPPGRAAAHPVRLVHVGFGKILGADGKPFKTRSGDPVKLGDLLDEAVARALAVVNEKNPGLPEAQRREIARVVGIGAVKYADLLPNRQSDYVFSWDKMLSLHGNTAPYLQYARARIAGILRKAERGDGKAEIRLETVEELALARQLLNFGGVLEAVAEDFRPNYLCNYLYELAGTFAKFYEACPVLKSEGETRASRLALCDLAGRVLERGLNALGIEALERM